jgi:hypothetical protein
MREQSISPVSEVPHFRRLMAAFVSGKPKPNMAMFGFFYHTRGSSPAPDVKFLRWDISHSDYDG